MTDSMSSIAKQIAVKTFTGFSANRATQMAAALSYYTVFSLAPLLVVILMATGFVLRQSGLGSEQEVREKTIRQIQNVVGEGPAEQIAEMLAAVSVRQDGWMTTIGNLAAVLLGATVVVVQLQSSLNQCWQVQPDPTRGGIRPFIVKRILSLAMVLGIALLMLVVVVLTTAIDVLKNRFFNVLPAVLQQWLDQGWLAQLIYVVLQVVLVAVLIGAIYQVLPDCIIRWRDVVVGTLVTAIALVAGRYAIGLYLSTLDVTSGFGAAGSLAVLLIWIYYSALIFFFGAEFTHAYILVWGGRLIPEEGAVHVVRETKPVADSEIPDSVSSEDR